MKKGVILVLALLAGLMSLTQESGNAESGTIFAPEQRTDRGTPPPLFPPVKEATPAEALEIATPDEVILEERSSPAELRDIYESEALKAIRSGERILVRGREGEDVRLIQARLSALGYDVGEIDGVYGRRTVRAVQLFQEKNHLEKVDGKTGAATLEALFTWGARAVPSPTPTPKPTATPTPTPTPTPIPTPGPTRTPSIKGAPIRLETGKVTIQGGTFTLMLGQNEEKTILYPVGSILSFLLYDETALPGSFTFTRAIDGREITFLVPETDGQCKDLMGAVDGILFLPETEDIYLWDGEIYASRIFLNQLGLLVYEREIPVITELQTDDGAE